MSRTLAPLAAALAIVASSTVADEPAAIVLPADAQLGQVLEISLPGGVPMKFCWCPPGEFKMGLPQTPKEKANGIGGQVPVRITMGFWLGQTEVTQAQRAALQLVHRGHEDPPGPRPDHPTWCNGYSWAHPDPRSAIGMIGAFASVVRLPDGWTFSLPTEAQWEYACRAGTETEFHCGDVLDGKAANCNGEYPLGTDVKGPNLGEVCAVASYPPNAWGLHDMHGNVAEWCLDWYAPELAGGDDPTGPKEPPGEKPERVTRGGAYASRAVYCRSGYRKARHPGAHETGLGLRPAIVPTATQPPAE